MISSPEEQLLESRLVYSIDRYRITLVIGQPTDVAPTLLRRYRSDQILWWRAAESLPTTNKSGIRECTIDLATVFREMTAATTYAFLIVVDPLPPSLAADVLWAFLRRNQDETNSSMRLLILCSTLVEGQRTLKLLLGETNAASILDQGSATSSAEKENACSVLTWGPPRTPIPMAFRVAPTADYIEMLIETIFQIHVQYPDTGGDILGLVPSLGDNVDRILQKNSEEYWDHHASSKKIPRVEFVMLHHVGRLPPPGTSRRRVYYTTPTVLESSTTCVIPNIQSIVDSGWTNCAYFDATSGLERTTRVPVDREAARQRASAWVTHPVGAHYVGLYTEQDMDRASSVPSFLARSNLTQFVFLCKLTGIDPLFALDFPEFAPTIEGIQYALEILHALGAIDDRTELTELGRQMGAFSSVVEPRIARMLLAVAARPLLSNDILTLASLMQVLQDAPELSLFRAKPRHVQQQMLDYEEAMAGLVDPSGDHVSYCTALSQLGLSYTSIDDLCREHFLHVPTVRACLRRRVQLQPILAAMLRRDEGRSERRDFVEPSILIRQCLLAGFCMNVAQLDRDGQYVLLRDQSTRVIPAPSSVYSQYTKLTSAYICFSSSSASPSLPDVHVHGVSALEAQWLQEIVPHYYTANAATHVVE
jgi:pre-mRNA-splicing factor ATP-dependent RNA helicase DHX16